MESKDKPICRNVVTTVFPDRLLVQSKRIISFDDIICINAIPCQFRSYSDSDENDNETIYFTEIISSNNKKIILVECEDEFIDAFKKYKNLKFNATLRTDKVISRFGKFKFWLSSLLFASSPLRVTLWSIDQNQTPLI